MDFYAVIIADTFRRLYFGKRNGVASSQATEDGSTHWEKSSQPLKLSEIMRHRTLSVLRPAFSNMFPLGRVEERLNGVPKTGT